MALSWWPWDWFFDAPANNGLQMNVLDDGSSLEYVSSYCASKLTGIDLTTDFVISWKGRDLERHPDLLARRRVKVPRATFR